MKKLFVAIIIAASTAANAYYIPGASCKSIGGLAESAMSARQAGVALSDMIEIARKGDDKILNDVTEKIVMDAFTFSRYQSPSVVQRAVQGFREIIEKQCFKETAAMKDAL